mgnify:CR=1 FL=1|tara:strand:+ start:642 stop:1646 length:1005 start_codon:yes stop_codon:yes gene_type:complete
MENKIIAFGGYYGTGGSVVRDLFKEYKNIFVFPSEFRLLIENKGLLDLENTIFNNCGCENIDLALKDFLWLTKHLSRKTTKFTRKGFDYDFYTNGNFSKDIKIFINEIVDYQYFMNWHYYDFQKSYFLSQFHRYSSRILGYKTYQKKAYMSYPDFEKFTNSAKKLIRKTILSSCKNTINENSIFAIHNAVRPIHNETINKSHNYFENLSMIFVDRDPRDIFLDFPFDRYMAINAAPLEKAKNFVKFFLDLRREQKIISSRSDVLFLKFEELVLKYDSQVSKINNFIGQSEKIDKLNKKFFDPNKSIKNIGKYNNVSKEYKLAIKYIEDKLTDFI